MTDQVREHAPEGEITGFVVRRTTTVVFKRAELAAFLGFPGQVVVTCGHEPQDEEHCALTFVDAQPKV